MERDVAKRWEWVERLRRFSAVGMGVADFCDAEGVSVSAFYVWRGKLSSGQVRGQTVTAAGDSASQRTFLPVRVVPQSPVPAVGQPGTSRAQLEIVLTNGVRVLVPTSEVAVMRQAIFAAGQIPTIGEDTSC